MRFRPAVIFAPLLAACSLVGGRVETLSHARSFHSAILAIAPVRGAHGRGSEISRALSKSLAKVGIRAAALEDSDSVIAGSSLGLDVASDPRALAEISRATSADGLVFLSFDPRWSSLEISVLDSDTGDPVLQAIAHPRGDVFSTPEDAAEAVARALAPLAPVRIRRTRVKEPEAFEPRDIPIP